MGGNLVSLFGDRIYLIALPWLVYNLTGSTVAMGAIAAVERLPNLLQPLMGTLVDRLDRKKIMLFCDLVRSFLLCSLGALDVSGHLVMWELYAGALILGVSSQFYQTSQFAFIPSLVRTEERHLMNAFNSGVFHTAEFIGPAIGGLVIGLYGPGWALIANGVSFLASFWAVTLIPFPRLEGFHHSRFWVELKEGFRFVLKNRLLLYTNAALLISGFGTTLFLTLMVFYFRDAAGLDAKQTGIILSVGGLVAVGGAFSSNVLRDYVSDRLVIIGGLIIGGLSIIWFGVVTSFSMLLVSNALGVLAVSILNPCILTLRQSLIPDHLLGRVQAVSRFMTWSLMPVAALLAGGLSAIWGIGSVIVIGGVIRCLAALILLKK
ncbi:MAG TPA: MFS transporter [Bacillales bacterium]|nr:MFS transporter [Bacillales bacterium]